MLFEPALRFPISRAEPFDLEPEPARVVHFLQVRQLMENDVIANENGSLDEAPIQGDGAAAGTGAPTRTLVAHGDTPDRQIVQNSELDDPRRQLAQSEAPEVPLNFRSQVRGDVFNRNQFSPKTDEIAVIVSAWFDHGFLAAKENRGAWDARLGCSGCPAKELALEPAKVGLRKTQGFGCRAAAWNRHAGRPVTPEAKDIAAGAAVGHEAKAHVSGAHSQPLLAQRQGADSISETER